MESDLKELETKQFELWRKEKSDIDVLARAAALGLVSLVVSAIALIVSVVAILLVLFREAG